MARTPSTMAPLGTPAPNFVLHDPTGAVWSRDDFSASASLLVVFLSNHCPFVHHLRVQLAEFARDYQKKGLAIVAINSNDADAYPADNAEAMTREIRSVGYSFPYLIDQDQAVAKAYRAACTPDFFLFDRERRLAYRGQFDDSRPGSDAAVTGADLRAAADRVLAGQPVPEEQRASVGCNIKWRPGNEPDYFG